MTSESDLQEMLHESRWGEENLWRFIQRRV